MYQNSITLNISHEMIDTYTINTGNITNKCATIMIKIIYDKFRIIYDKIVAYDLYIQLWNIIFGKISPVCRDDMRNWAVQICD